MSPLSSSQGRVILDFSLLCRRASQWPWPGKVLLGAMLAGLLWAIGETFYLGEAREHLHRQEAREVALHEQFAEKAVRSADLEARVRQLETMRSAFVEQLHRLPTATEVPGLLEDITRLGITSGLTLEEFRLLEEHAQPLYIELPIHITLVGTYHDLATFVSGVAELPRIVTLHDFVIRPVDAPGSGLLRLKMLAKTYRYSEPEPLS